MADLLPRTPDPGSAASPVARDGPAPVRLWGVDFTSAPGPKKPITVAEGQWQTAGSHRRLRLLALHRLPSLAAFEAWLAQPGPWLGVFDFPFGLPRAFVQAQAWGPGVRDVVAAMRSRCADRMAWRGFIDEWGNRQPAGQRLLHRQTDQAWPGLSSTSPLQTRYVPVGFMFYEGLPRLLQAGVHLPGLCAGDPARTALEGWPGLLAHELLGRRSYKNDGSAERLLARKDALEALEQGRTRLGLRLQLSGAMAGELVDDASGDLLDAVFCLVQAAWASGQPGCGMPSSADPVEGWICSMPWAEPAASPRAG